MIPQWILIRSSAIYLCSISAPASQFTFDLDFSVTWCGFGSSGATDSVFSLQQNPTHQLKYVQEYKGMIYRRQIYTFASSILQTIKQINLNFIYFITITKTSYITYINHARWHWCLCLDGPRGGGNRSTRRKPILEQGVIYAILNYAVKSLDMKMTSLNQTTPSFEEHHVTTQHAQQSWYNSHTSTLKYGWNMVVVSTLIQHWNVVEMKL